MVIQRLTTVMYEMVVTLLMIVALHLIVQVIVLTALRTGQQTVTVMMVYGELISYVLNGTVIMVDVAQ